MVGVMKRDKNGITTQIRENITFSEAFSLVWDLRTQRDGNFYWIGTK